MSRGDWDSRSSSRGTRRGDDFSEDNADPRARQGSRRVSPSSSRDPRDGRSSRDGRSERDYDERRGERGGSSRDAGRPSARDRDPRDGRDGRDDRSTRDPHYRRSERDYDERRGERGGSSRDAGRPPSRRYADDDSRDDRGRSSSRAPERSRRYDDDGPGGARGGSRGGERSPARPARSARDDSWEQPSRGGARWGDDSMEAPRARRGTPPVAAGRGGRPGSWGDDAPGPGGSRARDPRMRSAGSRGTGRPGERGAARKPQNQGKSIAIVFGLVLLALALGTGAGFVYFYKIEKVQPPTTSSSTAGAPQSHISHMSTAALVYRPGTLLVRV